MARAYPSYHEYNFAVANLQLCGQTEELRAGKVEWTSNREPFVIRGGYSSVYAVMLSGGRKVALRVWTREVEQAQQRYSYLARAFATATPPSPYVVRVNYIENALLAKDELWPVTVMDWIEATTLGEFLDNHIQEPQTLRLLAERFLEMVTAMHALQWSHGDYQEENLLVISTGSGYRLMLIDYDSFHVPAMGTTNSFVLGVPNYQHPNRKNPCLGATADHFSELVIYLSLLAYAEDPTLWTPKQDKQLLFSALDDYKNPDRSMRFATLLKLSADIRYLTNRLQEFCAADPDKLPPLEEVVCLLPSRHTHHIVITEPLPQPPAPRPPIGQLSEGWRYVYGLVKENKRAEAEKNWERILDEVGTPPTSISRPRLPVRPVTVPPPMQRPSATLTTAQWAFIGGIVLLVAVILFALLIF